MADIFPWEVWIPLSPRAVGSALATCNHPLEANIMPVIPPVPVPVPCKAVAFINLEAPGITCSQRRTRTAAFLSAALCSRLRSAGARKGELIGAPEGVWEVVALRCERATPT